jgi:hypothetical protein
MKASSLIVAFCVITFAAAGQTPDLTLKKIKGGPSVVIDNKTVGFMDTTLFRVRGRITKVTEIRAGESPKGIYVALRNILDGKVIESSTDEKGNFELWGGQGAYNLEVSFVGLEKIAIRKLKLTSGEIRLFNAVLGTEAYYRAGRKE